MAVDPSCFKRMVRFENPREARALNFSCFRNQPLLRSERTCEWLANAIERAAIAHNCAIWAWCIMPTHVHILAFPRGDVPEVGAFLDSVKKSVTARARAWASVNSPAALRRMRHQREDGRIVHRFWQPGGGYDRNLDTPRTVWHMIRYIHLNPVEAGLCSAPWDWPWSSALAYKLGRQDAGSMITSRGITLDLSKLPEDRKASWRQA